jgi:hypothetical protein
MRKIWIMALMVMVVLMLSSVIPMTSVIGVPMPKPAGQPMDIYVSYSHPTLDGTVNVGSEWPEETHIGQSRIRDSPSSHTPTADVYALVEVGTSLTDYEFLWLGFDMIDPFYLDPSDGNYLYIDWDRDGTVDVWDKPQWGDDSYGIATAGGIEWMIPWHVIKQKQNDPGDEFIEDEDCCFDIYVHTQVHWPGGPSGGETSRWPEGGTDNNGDGDTTDPGDDHDNDGLINSEDPDDDNDGIPDDEDNTPFGDPTGGGGFDSVTLCPDKEIPPPEEPPENGWGLRTIGFWKHQLRCALGANGHQHVLTDNLLYYLWWIGEESEIPDYQNMNLQDALNLLELRGKHDMYEKAVQQLLATYLNLASDGDQEVDTGSHGTMDLSDAITWMEGQLMDYLDGDDVDLEEVKDMADYINNSGDE